MFFPPLCSSPTFFSLPPVLLRPSFRVLPPSLFFPLVPLALAFVLFPLPPFVFFSRVLLPSPQCSWALAFVFFPPQKLGHQKILSITRHYLYYSPGKVKKLVTGASAIFTNVNVNIILAGSSLFENKH